MGFAKERLTETDGQKRTLLQLQVQRLAPHFHEVLVLVGPNASPPVVDKSLRARTIADLPQHSGQGPLAGLLAALRACQTDWLALLAVDTPFFPPEAFWEAVERAPVGCQALGFQGPEGKPQWLPGLYCPALQASVEETLGLGQFSLGRWMQARQHAFLPWNSGQVPVWRAFANLNTPDAARRAGFEIPDEGGFKPEGRSIP